MESNFENIINFFDDVENIPDPEQIVPVIPRFTKCYLYGVDPFDFYSDDEFKQRYRFKKATVRQIILKELSGLQATSNRGLPIPIDIQLLIALRFYATGSFQKVCADLMFISQPTVCHIVGRVSKTLAGTLQKYISYPRNEELSRLKNDFKNLGASRNLPGLPNIIGAIDCTHIKINRPRGFSHSEAYRNRHGWFSINVQKGLAYKLTTSCNIILACCILHNIAIKYEKNCDYEDFVEINNVLLQTQIQETHHAAEGLALRSELIRRLYS